MPTSSEYLPMEIDRESMHLKNCFIAQPWDLPQMKMKIFWTEFPFVKINRNLLKLLIIQWHRIKLINCLLKIYYPNRNESLKEVAWHKKPSTTWTNGLNWKKKSAINLRSFISQRWKLHHISVSYVKVLHSYFHCRLLLLSLRVKKISCQWSFRSIGEGNKIWNFYQNASKLCSCLHTHILSLTYYIIYHRFFSLFDLWTLQVFAFIARKKLICF